MAAASPVSHRPRQLAGRRFGKLGTFRAIAGREDEGHDDFRAAVQLASTRIWLRRNDQVA